MAYGATVFRVFIASPSDVPQERSLVRQVLLEWNNSSGRRRNVYLQGVGWESDSLPVVGVEPQAAVNQQLLLDADAVIAVFGNRLGSPTSTHMSGTVEEIETHVRAGKLACVYISSRPVAPAGLDPVEQARLREYLRDLFKRALVDSFSELETFARKLREHLDMIVDRLLVSHSEVRAAQELGRRISGLRSSKVVMEFAGRLAEIEQLDDPFYYGVALNCAERAIRTLSQLGQGTVHVDTGTDVCALATQLSARMRRLDATTLWSAGNPSRRLSSLREVQRQRILMGDAAVRRLFVVAEEDIASPVLLERMAGDAEGGVEVRWIRQHEWVPEAPGASPRDFGIWDDELIWRYERVTDQTNREWRALIVREATCVADHRRLFDANWALAQRARE